MENIEMTDKQTIKCMDCENIIEMEDVEVGKIAVCDKCGLEMELINTSPIEVDYLFAMK